MYQLLEVIILAAIAFFVISNLISSVGTVDEEDPTLDQKSKNNIDGMKDVTDTIMNAEYKESGVYKNFNYQEIKKYFLDSLTNDDILKIITTLNESKIFFSADKFLNGAKSAFKMIIEEIKKGGNIKNTNEVLANLIDKRYINDFIASINSKNYDELDLQNIKCLISDSYSFSRSVFINVSFFLNNNAIEEWTFQKSPHNQSNIWILSNINTDVAT